MYAEWTYDCVWRNKLWFKSAQYNDQLLQIYLPWVLTIFISFLVQSLHRKKLDSKIALVSISYDLEMNSDIEMQFNT